MKRKIFLIFIIMLIICTVGSVNAGEQIENEIAVQEMEDIENDETKQEEIEQDVVNEENNAENNEENNEENVVVYERKDTRVIEEGIYIISLSNDPNKVIEVASLKNDDGVNIQVGNLQNGISRQKKFRCTYNENDGYYTIESINSGKVLDAANGGMINGTNIWQYASNYTDAQRWKIEKNIDGTYSFICKKSGLYIEAKNNNIETNEKNDSECQKFNLTSANIMESEEYIDEGTYKILPVSNGDLAISIENASRQSLANVVLGSALATMRNEFNVKLDKDGYYTISSINSGNVLDAANGGMADCTNVWQYVENKTDAQKWIIKHNIDDNTYSIISKKNGLYVDVANGNASDGNNIWLYSGNGTNAQKFIFVRQESKTEKYIEEYKYRVASVLNGYIGFDIEGASTNDGAVLQIWTWENVRQQQFELRYVNGYYFLVNKNSNKAIEAKNGRIEQYPVDYSKENQKWILKLVRGSYAFVSMSTGKCIEIPNWNISNGIDLQLADFTESYNQLFNLYTFKEIELETGTYGLSGLSAINDSRASSLKYYKIGDGQNIFFGTFAVHGFEDLWNYDGQELTKIAEQFKDKLVSMQDENLANKWTIYIFPSVNPDGEYHGYTNNGPGRTSLYSSAPTHQGIDINRCWSTSYTRATSSRNYNGIAPFQSYEAVSLRNFMLNRRATNGQTILVDLHGWLNETIGDNWIGSYYRSEFGMSTHINSYGSGYLVNWARTNLGYNGRTARAALIEMPEVYSSSQVDNYGFANKYINATINMLRSY